MPELHDLLQRAAQQPTRRPDVNAMWRRSRQMRRRRRALSTAFVTACLIAFGGTLAFIADGNDHQTLDVIAPPETTMASSETSSTTPPAATAAAPSVVSTATATLEVALPSASGVVLFAHTSDPSAVLRIDIDRGRVVTTPVGAVTSTAPAFLAVGPSAAVVRPYDFVRGYMVADSGTVSDPPGLLGDGTSMVCSDGGRDRVWLEHDALIQVDYRGVLIAQIGGAQRRAELGCDGAGETLYQQGSTTFVTSDGTPTEVTGGTVIAAGPSTFLVRDCADAANCALTVIDRRTGQRRALTVDGVSTRPVLQPVQPGGRIGSISPDGQTALLFRTANEAVFVDMKDGTAQGVGSVASAFQSFVWSADSRYAFFIQANHTLVAFDREERHIKSLGVNNVLALASRPI